MDKNFDGHDQLGWALAVSLAAHILVAAAVILWPAGEPDRQFFSPAYQVSLVSAPPSSGGPAKAPAAAPKKEVAKPKPAPTPAPQPKAEPKPKPQPKAFEPPKPQPKPKEAIGDKKTVEPKRVKRVEKKAEPEPSYEEILDQRLKKIKSKAESRRQDDQLEDALSQLESKVQSGGGGAAGPSGAVAMPGGGGDLSNRFQIYYTELWERIRRAWILPEALAGDTSGAMAVVVLRINRDGSLDKFWLEESSGNARLDQSALRAVERAAPYPPLPSGLVGPYHEVGMRFRPEEAGQ